MSKIYLAISTQNEEKNIESLTSVYDSFDGICAVDHFSTDKTFDILKSRCKEGFVEQIKYYGHHGHDLNHVLFNPQIRVGDWLLLRDSSERINPDFAVNIKPFIKMLENSGVNSVYQYSKLLLFRRFPHQYFLNTPHWGFHGAQSKTIAIEQQNWFTVDFEYCYSSRVNRDKYHFVDAFMRYYLILDSNHNLLGLENFGDPTQLFPTLEAGRIDFIFYLQELKINTNVDAVKEYFINEPLLPDKMKEFINNNLILNQFYRFWKLKDITVSPDIKAPIVQIT